MLEQTGASITHRSLTSLIYDDDYFVCFVTFAIVFYTFFLSSENTFNGSASDALYLESSEKNRFLIPSGFHMHMATYKRQHDGFLGLAWLGFLIKASWAWRTEMSLSEFPFGMWTAENLSPARQLNQQQTNKQTKITTLEMRYLIRWNATWTFTMALHYTHISHEQQIDRSNFQFIWKYTHRVYNVSNIWRMNILNQNRKLKKKKTLGRINAHIFESFVINQSIWI